MANKEQKRGNKEAKKPKKQPAPAAPGSASKSGQPPINVPKKD
jgi:hypothetical protein